MPASSSSRTRSRPTPPPAPEAPLAAEVLSRPGPFGAAVAASGVPPWHYWPAVALAALLSGLSYALLLRPGVNLAAEAARAGGQAAQFTPPLLTHVGNAFGNVFLTVLTFGVMWGLGRLATRTAASPAAAVPVAQVFAATFTLPILLNVLVLALVFLTPAAAWALDAGQVAAAQGQPLLLQRAALAAAAQTPAALALIAASLLGTVAQCVLAARALRGLTPRAVWVGLLALLPALGLQLLGLAPLLLARAAS
ncbi:MAG: hypothetical protein Q4C89_07355 [Deinococcus sp.]|uniref:hypothetical protein n=1 Tax=Deinococcus sp. TaxID=47478 RepID=UPI0026DA720F|nr:hypothetical protein [Deinococcus sp.]MDO4245821.1 hypothetical protein [Deinococcus sp.]